MTQGLPQGVREDELTSFTSEHPMGVEVTFERVTDGGWQVELVEAVPNLADKSVERAVNALVHDVERHGDARVLNWE